MGKKSKRVRTKQTKEELKKIKIILMEKLNMTAKGEQRYLTNKDTKLIGKWGRGFLNDTGPNYTIHSSADFVLKIEPK
tara:strand:- start:601 stop:834 length:234 start_codon:yes stop_codon:yes gene_type:complete